MRLLSQLVLILVTSQVVAGDKADVAALRKAMTLHASFDDAVAADFSGGGKTFDTRTNHPTEKGAFVFTKGFDEKVFRIARGKGVKGGALEAVDVLPNNGRIFLPVKGNLAFKKGGWGGAFSLWINTDPDKLLKTKFCDPIQITEKGANNGGIWVDFNNDSPRTSRMGVFPAVKPGEKGVGEDEPGAPLFPVPKPGFKQGDWHHIVVSWKNLDTGEKNGAATLYIDGKKIGAIENRDLAMDWNVDKAGVYVAINYIGLLDELMLFGRELTPGEVTLLYQQPGLPK